jgi:acetylornithine deacetylase/succinyl-diaminopimelate desuccinylase-like protein
MNTQVPSTTSAAKAKVLAKLPETHAESVAHLRQWIASPSIAAENPTCPQGAQHMLALLRWAGFDPAVILPTAGKPGVLATLDVGAATTLGVYFRYDVVPFDPTEWSVPPLEGRLVQLDDVGIVCYGRGAFDQQGPQISFLGALRAFQAAGVQLPVNLVLVAEGEEEIGSPHLDRLVGDPRVSSRLKPCVGVILPEASQAIDGSVEIFLGAKGIVDVELVASGEQWGRGPKFEVHSSRAAQLDNPAWHLIRALNTLICADGHTVAIDGFFDRARPPSSTELHMIEGYALDADEGAAKRLLGAERWVSNLSWRDSLFRLYSAPTINLQGLMSGYTGAASKAVLPHRAVAKIDFRLVPSMTAAQVVSQIRAHLANRGFGDIEVNMTAGYDATETDMEAELIKCAQTAYCTFGTRTTMLPRSPGSWPGCVFSKPPLNLPVATFGLGYGNGAHGPDEYYLIESVKPGLHGLDGASASFVEILYALA